jgi:thymidylate synthase ThyX
LPALDYMPTPERVMANTAGGNKQAGALRGAEELTLESALAGLSELADLYEHSERCYQGLPRRGFAKELARLANTVGRYSTMRASTDLRNWLAFTTLRCSPGAQQEIRLYADAALAVLRRSFPRTVALFDELRRGP